MADDDTVTPELPLEPAQEQPTAEAPAAEVVVTDPPAAVAEVAPETPAAEPTEAEQQDWRDKELRKKHAQIKDKDRELERIRKENEDLRALAQRPKPAATEEPIIELPRTPSMTQDQVKEAARQLREQERYQENLVNINSSGEKSYGKDWAKALDNLATLGTVEVDTMQAIIGTDDPAKVLYELGKNPAEYQRIMDLPKARQHTEFVKLSLKQAPKAAVSSAPEPVETVRGRVTPSAMPQDSDDDDTWYAKWEAAQAAKRKKSA